MSSSSSSTSLFTPLQFTGISQYSSDFQSILTRAVGIAQIPMMQLQNQQTTIQQEQTAMSTLGVAASAVGLALQALGKIGSGQGLTASSTDTSAVTATNTGATATASYSITDVTSVASPASESSATGYADGTTAQVSSTGTMQLVFGSNTYTLNLAAGQNNLAGVRDAINALGAGVTASVLTAGGTNGNYLAISANSPGETTLKLVDDPSGAATNILTSTNQGKNTNFKLNGIPISAPSATINSVIPGLTLTINSTTAQNETVTVALSNDRSQISTALQNLVAGYNALATQESAQFGKTAGALSGNNIIYQIRQAMSSIVQYQGSGSMSNLANLGIEMSQSGLMSFNQQTFNSLSDADVSSSLQLLGSSTTGIGGIQQSFSALTDPITGTIASQNSQWAATLQKLTDQISTKTTQIQAMEQTLNQRLQAADASVAKLASQQNILTASITSLNYTSYGYNSNISTTKST